MRIITVALLFLLPTTLSHAQDLELRGELKEKVYDAAPTSGATVLGARALGQQDGPPRFSVFMDHAWERICLRLFTSDGLFVSEGTYVDPLAQDRGERPARERHGATYGPTDATDMLTSLGTDDLAVMLQPGECGPVEFGAGTSRDRPIELAVALWRQEGPGDEVVLFVNSLAADRVEVGRGIQSLGDCVAPEAEVLTAYNLVCRLPLVDLPGTEADIRLTPYVEGNREPPIWVRLHLPREG